VLVWHLFVQDNDGLHFKTIVEFLSGNFGVLKILHDLPLSAVNFILKMLY